MLRRPCAEPSVHAPGQRRARAHIAEELLLVLLDVDDRSGRERLEGAGRVPFRGAAEAALQDGADMGRNRERSWRLIHAGCIDHAGK